MLANYSANTLNLLYKLKHCPKNQRKKIKLKIYKIELCEIQKNILRSSNIKKEIFDRDFKRIEVKLLTQMKFPQKSLTNKKSVRNKLARLHILAVYKLLIAKKPQYWIIEKIIRLTDPITIAFIKVELNAKSIEIFKYTKTVTH